MYPHVLHPGTPVRITAYHDPAYIGLPALVAYGPYTATDAGEYRPRHGARLVVAGEAVELWDVGLEREER